MQQHLPSTLLVWIENHSTQKYQEEKTTKNVFQFGSLSCRTLNVNTSFESVIQSIRVCEGRVELYMLLSGVHAYDIVVHLAHVISAMKHWCEFRVWSFAPIAILNANVCARLRSLALLNVSQSQASPWSIYECVTVAVMMEGSSAEWNLQEIKNFHTWRKLITSFCCIG